MIKNIVFDFGKVLVDYDFNVYVSSLFDGDKEKESRYLSIITAEEFNIPSDRGDMPFKDFIRMQEELHPEFAPQLHLMLDRYIDAITGEIPGMRELLVDLKGRGYRLLGLTNWCESIYDVLKAYDIFSLLDGMLISCEEKMIKPDPAIYRRLCEKFSILPNESVFIDDRIANVEAAAKEGFTALLFKDTENLKCELDDIL